MAKSKKKKKTNKKTPPMNLSKEPKLKLNDLNIEEIYSYLAKQPTSRKMLSYAKLNSENKRAYKDFRKLKLLNENKNKEDFNKENLFEVRNFNFWYKGGTKQALYDINLDIKKGHVTSLIGPSGCGKSTFLKNLNRMNDLVDDVIINGDIWLNGRNIRSKSFKEIELRTMVGMVFQKPTPFEMSIYDNVAFGPRAHGIRSKKVLDKIVEESLKGAALWDEVKHELHTGSGNGLSGGQQQRLCIARAIALKPKVLLMDEPTSALDPIATAKIEDLIITLSKYMTIIIVTHSMAQAQRISDDTVFFYQGRIIESGTTKKIFTKPKNKQTKDYVNGKIG